MNNTILLLIHGKSIETLEQRIQEFKDLPVSWGSMSTFEVPQEFILDKINKKFDLVFDSSTVKNEETYEKEVRIPRLEKYFSTSSGKYICTRTDKSNLYSLRNRIYPDFNNKYKDRIICAEDINIDPIPFCVSLHLFIACVAKLGYKNIFLFGADGGGIEGNSIESYYKHDIIRKDKEIADNTSYNMIGDTGNINSTFTPMMMQCLGYIPRVFNCSPITRYTVFPIISYDNVLQEIRNNL